MYERIKNLCKKNGTNINALERNLGFAKGSLCKMANHKPSMDRIQSIANYFNVSISEIISPDEISYDYDSHTWDINSEYYINKEASDYAQFLKDNPGHRVLFDAAKNVKAEDLQKALKAIGIFTEE